MAFIAASLAAPAALSGFGLVMSVATVYVVPPNREPLVWLAIFLVCAVVIAKQTTERRFLHGLYVSLCNAVWITTAHIVLFDDYIARHPDEAAMAAKMGSPRSMMLVTGPLVGAVSGCILGLFAYVAGRLLNPARKG